MSDEQQPGAGDWKHRLNQHLAQPQHRNTYFLLLNTLAAAATGLAFWLLLTRLAALPPAAIGVGYTIVAIGTIIGIIAKGGFDTAIIRSVPAASRFDAAALLSHAVRIGTVVCLSLCALVATAAVVTGRLPEVGYVGWLIVAATACLLLVTWLQDAYFLAEGDAKLSFHRNLALSGGRLLVPLPIIALGAPQPVALSWMLAIALSALAAATFAARLPDRQGQAVSRRQFHATALRNLSGSAAEFLPGLLLAPFVMLARGPEAAAYFGIAWTAASLLFLSSAAVCRSALGQFVRDGRAGQARAIRRAALHHLALLVPAAAIGVALAPYIMTIFGIAYAANATLAFTLLCASLLVVAPVNLYLALLRAREKPLSLILYPLTLLALLGVLAYFLEPRLGVTGVALAWILANAPLALVATWKLFGARRGVITPGPAPVVAGAAHTQ